MLPRSTTPAPRRRGRAPPARRTMRAGSPSGALRHLFTMSAPLARTWTPQQLADALRAIGVPRLSRQNIWRACLAGDIPHDRTPGGHLRIRDEYVQRVWPGLGAQDD